MPKRQQEAPDRQQGGGGGFGNHAGARQYADARLGLVGKVHDNAAGGTIERIADPDPAIMHGILNIEHDAHVGGDLYEFAIAYDPVGRRQDRT